jgi:DNA-binding transcriptional ArsR family regulator
MGTLIGYMMHRRVAHADVFQAIADPTRRALLDRLRGGNVATADLARGFQMSCPAVSKHLAVLRRSGLVSERRQGRHRLYRLQADRLRAIAVWAGGYRAFWETNLAGLKRHLERKEEP